MSLTTAEYLATYMVLAGIAIMAAMGHGLDRRVRGLAVSRVHWSVEH